MDVNVEGTVGEDRERKLQPGTSSELRATAKPNQSFTHAWLQPRLIVFRHDAGTDIFDAAVHLEAEKRGMRRGDVRFYCCERKEGGMQVPVLVTDTEEFAGILPRAIVVPYRLRAMF
ncbi:hypothetical protein PoB_000157200 [Plakobranchus ocellatus]|uniref:Uncharacterized protein n=1 Tax=Plakobranchus ocellatus TaxID=259542 RepID=A0AAV3XYZ1_9GAST|nr:hypothetical protein PoB_000157200 [Plakobranchus ocellatus]